MNLIVELLGAPGVGKSTLLPDLVERLHPLPLQDAPHLDRARQAIGFARFLTRNPLQLARTIAAIAATGQPTRGDLAWVTRTWVKRCWRHAELRRSPGLHLVDAGLAQALWSIAFRASAQLSPRLVTGPLPDLVLVVNTTIATMTRRLAMRPGQQSRLERGAEDLERAREQVVSVRRHLERAGVETFSVDYDRDEDRARVATMLAARVTRRWSR